MPKNVIVKNKHGYNLFETLDGVLYKRCSKCNELLPFNTDFFSKKTKGTRGLDSGCISCRKKEWAEKNKPVIIRPNDKGEYFCYKCGSFKSLDSFYKDTTNKYRKGHSTICIECSQSMRKNSYLNRSIEKYLFSTYYRCSRRERIRGGICDFDKTYLLELYNKQKGKCAITGIDMTYEAGSGKKYNTISLDRIDSSKGYVKDNIQFVCYMVNVMKLNQSMEDFLFLCKQVVEYNFPEILK